MKSSQKEVDQERREREFLIYVGFDISNGWWDEDYQQLRKENPHEHWMIFEYE